VTGSVDESETTYTSPPLGNGTWYVHVASYDPTGACPINPKTGDVNCKKEWSSPVVAQVGSGPAPGAGDIVTSFALLEVSSHQRLTRLRVRAAMPERGTITVGGTIEIPAGRKARKLKAVAAAVTAGRVVTVRVKLAKKVSKAARKALERHVKVRARLTVTAVDAAGNRTAQKRVVRLGL
jgi:hypothetical protein